MVASQLKQKKNPNKAPNCAYISSLERKVEQINSRCIFFFLLFIANSTFGRGSEIVMRISRQKPGRSGK